MIQQHPFGAQFGVAHLLCLVIGIGCPFPMYAEDQPDTYRKAYDLAFTELQAGQIDKARGLIQQLVNRQNRPELHNLLGDVEEAAGHFREAAREYETAARMDPSEKNLFDLGTELLKYRGYQQAFQVFTYGAAKLPDSAKLRVGLGVSQYSLGQYKDAVETLCKAVDLDPKDARALEFLGKMYDVAPELAGEVRDRLQRFASLYPDNAAANYYYALSLGAIEGDELSPKIAAQIESLLQRAIGSKPEFADAHFQLGLLYEKEKHDVGAVHEFEIAIQSRPDLKSAHYRLAQLYAKLGKRELAQKEYQLVKSLGRN